ncbi:MAG: GYD domain-containing protein [Gemmatimonadales bacterium]
MPTYLLQGSYTSEGVKGLAKDGGTKRRATVKEMVEKAGGKVHAFYFALGDSDVYTIVEFPDAATAVAVSLAVNGSGAVNLKTTALLSPEDFDAAAKQSIGYRPPGA